jgi:amino acid transporter
MGPVFSVALLFPLVVGASNSGKGAGVATPMAIIIAAIGTAALAWIISRYARKISTCGALYDYVTSAVGEVPGFLSGWIYYGGAQIFAAIGVMITAGITSDFLASAVHVQIAWWVVGLALTAFVFVIQYLGVKLATRAQLLFAGFSVLAVLLFSIWVIIRAPGGLSVAPFDLTKVGFSGICFGVIYGIALFIGFESSANLAEECAEPRRAIPRALLGTLGVVVVYYVICSYAQALGFGLDAKAWAASQTPLTVLGGDPRYGSAFLADLLAAVVIIDAIAVSIGGAVVATRGVYKLARDRHAPIALARTHPKHGTPVAAALVPAGLTVLTIIITHASNGLLSRATPDPKVILPEYMPLWLWLATLAPFMFLLIYLVVALTAVRGLRDDENRGGVLLASLIGAGVAIGALFGFVYKAQSPFSLIPYYAIAWLLLGIGWMVFLRVRRARAEAATPLSAPQEAEA